MATYWSAWSSISIAAHVLRIRADPRQTVAGPQRPERLAQDRPVLGPNPQGPGERANGPRAIAERDDVAREVASGPLEQIVVRGPRGAVALHTLEHLRDE